MEIFSPVTDGSDCICSTLIIISSHMVQVAYAVQVRTDPGDLTRRMIVVEMRDLLGSNRYTLPGAWNDDAFMAYW
jgi:hypothetical protein